jgi:aryl-alcohol dehydrogenase-like predicted oxidoreductase
MDNDEEREPGGEALDKSHELDTVIFFRSSAHDAEMEAMAIHALLQSNGIASTLVGPATIPSLEFQVQVPKADLPEAERIVAEARDAGAAGAEEAEEASEKAN